MSPFAAGCAVCGADLDTKRWDTGPGALNRVGSWFNALGMGSSRGGWYLIAGVVVAAFVLSYLL